MPDGNQETSPVVIAKSVEVMDYKYSMEDVADEAMLLAVSVPVELVEGFVRAPDCRVPADSANFLGDRSVSFIE